MRNQQNTKYRVKWTIEADAMSAEAAAGMAQGDHCGMEGFDEATEVTGVSEGHTVDVVRPRVKTYVEKLTKNTATLRTHGKLVETVVETAWNMALARFRPNDSYEVHNLAKDWAAEYEALYDDRVAVTSPRCTRSWTTARDHITSTGWRRDVKITMMPYPERGARCRRPCCWP